MKKRSLLFFAFLLLGLFGAWGQDFSHAQSESPPAVDCDPLGWFPEDFGLKDHTVFIYDGYYYLASIYLPGEQKFAYARSQDLCHWEDLSPILDQRTGVWDAEQVWAPSVLEENGVFYMFYTGVRYEYPNFTQSIMLATSTDPADPASWEQQGMIFQPDHEGMVWQDGDWADCRDPDVIKVGNLYYLLYTGRDVDGGIIGLATASDPRGPWQDFGSILTLDVPGALESATIWQANGGYYLFYNHTQRGEEYRFGPAVGGPWSDPAPLFPGWAHEIWSGMDGQTYTSYLTDYTVTIKPLIWNTRYDPPRPFIGAQISEVFIPLIMH